MVDTIYDDVKELLKIEKGDPKILERIKRACEQDEVISVYEREYIQKLVAEHLAPKYDDIPTEPEIITESGQKSEEPQVRTIPEPISSKPVPQKPTFELQSNPKTTKIIFGIGAVALAIILVAGVSYSGVSLSDISDDTPTTPATSTKKTTSTSGLKVEVDASSYSLGDIISISGDSDSSGDVTLSIINGASQIIWQEKASLKTDGTYSTLSIAGGPGWESSGEYTLRVTQDLLTEEITFDFKK